MDFPKRSKFYETLEGLESVLIEEYPNVEILVSSHNNNPTSQTNLFLKGDFLINNDRVSFKGLYRMQYFHFYIKIYNLLSISRSADYIIFSISDLANVIQNHLIDRNKIFDDLNQTKSLEVELADKVKSHFGKRKPKPVLGHSGLVGQFKEGNEFELIGDFQIRVVMRNKVGLI
jgi:hypothetical protein